MSYTIIRPKDRNEWLEHRKSGIGSSEVATILGLNPWETLISFGDARLVLMNLKQRPLL